VGKRLAAIALRQVYGKNVVSGGPMYAATKINGNSVTITFTNTGSGLVVKGNNEKLAGFEIAGEDKVFYPGTARIVGNTVLVSSTSVTKPVAVRFGWSDDASVNNLFNKEGFPAAPFRTDSWKGVTENTKFVVR
jgi:sialate O-acetylesterase